MFGMLPHWKEWQQLQYSMHGPLDMDSYVLLPYRILVGSA